MKQTLFGIFFIVSFIFLISKGETIESSNYEFKLKKGIELFNDSLYEQAIPIFIECDSMFNSTGMNGIVAPARYLQQIYEKLGEYDSAIKYGLRLHDVFGGENTETYLDCLRDLIDEFYVIDSISAAIKYSEEYLKLMDLSPSFELETKANILYNLSYFHQVMQNYSESIKYGLEAYNIYIAVNINDSMSTNIGDAAFILMQNYGLIQEYDKAIKMGYKALNALSNLKNQNIQTYISTLQNLALLFSIQGNYVRAIELESQASKEIIQYYGYNSEETFTSLWELAEYYELNGDIKTSINLILQSLTILKSLKETNKVNYAITLSFLARLYKKNQDYDSCVKVSSEVIKILEEEWSLNNYTILNSLEYIKKYINTPDSIPNLDFNTDVTNSLEGLYDYFSSLNFRAICYSRKGLYTEALKDGYKLLQMILITTGMYNNWYAGVLSNLARYEADLGNFSRSLDLENKALLIYEMIEGSKNISYATSLTNMTSYYIQSGAISDAFNVGMQALEILNEIKEENNPAYANALNNLARVSIYQENYLNAIEFGEEAVKLRQELFGIKNPDVARSLSTLATCYMKIEDYERSIQLHQ